MSIVIALLSLAILGLLLDLAMKRLASRFSWKTGLRRGVAVVACVAVIGVAFVDQTPGDAAANYSRDAQRFADDNAYFGTIEASLPAKAMVLMLPYIPFPENSAPNGALASDQLIPYLHTSELRWSNGGIKGRPAADWPGQLANYPENDVALLGAVAGASGVLVERAALADRGASLEASLTSATGTQPLVSPSGEYAFYDVRALTDGKDDPAIRALLTDPVTPYGSPGFADILDESKKPAWGSLINQTSFTLANPTDSAISVTLSFDVTAPAGLSSTTITLPGQAAQTIQPVNGVASFSSTFDVAPGHSLVSVTALDGAGQPLPKFLLTNVSVVQTPVADFLSERSPG
jgi:phosphoglycerol transferase